MSLKKKVHGPVAWALGAGLAVGALAMASVMSGNGVGTAFAAPQAVVQPAANLSVEDSAVLHSLDNSFAALAEKVEPSVVNIRAEGKGNSVFGQNVQMGGEGSGVVYRQDGWIMTNDHVAGGFDKVTVVLNDGREFPGKVVRAPESDIAMVKIEATGLPAVRFADSAAVRTGQFAIAFGSPFGLEKSMTVGHVSGLSRQSSIPDARSSVVRTYGDLIQTDASINQGNSGGPLVNIDGEVVGINTAIYSESGGSVGIGFAIPASQAKLIAELLIEKGKVERGFMGVLPDDLKGFQKKDWKVENGAVATEVPNDGPAAAAGMKQNDVIVRIGTYTVRSQGDVRNAMLRYGPGSSVPVEVVRDGNSQVLNVKLGAAPATPEAPKAPTRPNRGGQTPEEDPFLQMPDIKKFFENPGGSQQDNQDVAPLRQGQAKLGVTVVDLDGAARKEQGVPVKVNGAVVTAVEPGSVAAKLGIQPGDLIQRMGDTVIKSAADVSKAMEGVQWGERRSIQLGRYSKDSTLSRTFTVTFR